MLGQIAHALGSGDILAAYVVAVVVFFHVGFLVFAGAWGRLVFVWMLRVVMQQIAARRELRLRIASAQRQDQKRSMRQFLRRNKRKGE